MVNENMDVSGVAVGGRVTPRPLEAGGIETTEAGKRITRAARLSDRKESRPGPPGFTSPDREDGALADDSDSYTPARARGADSEHPSARVPSGIDAIAHRVVDVVDHGPAAVFSGSAGGPHGHGIRPESADLATSD